MYHTQHPALSLQLSSLQTLARQWYPVRVKMRTCRAGERVGTLSPPPALCSSSPCSSPGLCPGWAWETGNRRRPRLGSILRTACCLRPRKVSKLTGWNWLLDFTARNTSSQVYKSQLPPLLLSVCVWFPQHTHTFTVLFLGCRNPHSFPSPHHFTPSFSLPCVPLTAQAVNWVLGLRLWVVA